MKLNKRINYLKSQIEILLKLDIAKAILLDDKIVSSAFVPPAVVNILKQLKMGNCGIGKAENRIGISVVGNKVFMFRRY